MQHLLQGDFKMTAQTLHGLEVVLMEELKALGARDITRHKRAVSFVGDLGTMYKMNLCLRTAIRILVPIHTFKVRSTDDLYHRTRKFAWEDLMDVDSTFSLGITVNSDHFEHSQYALQRAKDAIVDRFVHLQDRRPSVEKEQPDLRIHFYINHDVCLISLDSSGDSLHKRGYRSKTNLAPINEVLAAGLVLHSGWDKHSPFVDPMCGSGTILVEASMIAANVPPGYFREEFGFQRWQHFDQDLWETLYDKAISKIHGDVPKLIGGEISPNVTRKAKATILEANMGELVEIRNAPFAELERPEGEHGTLVINPPYGERMDKDDIHELYKMIGDTLKKNWQGYQAWVITSNVEAARSIKLTPRPKIQLFNGSLDCRFMRYEIYSGSKRGGVHTPATN